MAMAQTRFDLREESSVTKTKKQNWGTCWAFASLAAIESNLLRERNWNFKFEPDFSEYHMDKYSGFNRNGHADHLRHESYSGQGEGYLGSNTDTPKKGLIVHSGGDFKVAAAYLSNIGGAVEEFKTPGFGYSHNDHSRFGNTPTDGVLKENNYNYYLPSSIEWLTYGSFEENIQRIKESIMKHGSVGSSQLMQNEPHEYTLSGEEIHFYHGPKEPTHAINLIGWDDERAVIPFKPGVWIAQDSDHINEVTGHIGYFLTPYADTHTGQNLESGGVSFRGTYKRNFKKIHSHALHGWQYEYRAKKVSNLYKLENEIPTHVGIYTTVPNDQPIAFVTDLKGNMLCHTKKEIKENPGFYLLELRCEEESFKNQTYRVELETKSGLYAYDAEKAYKPLLGNSALPEFGSPLIVGSRANPGESFYYKDGTWKDFYFKSFPTETQYGLTVQKTETANFAINLFTK
ncbi:MAG: hypothetical protein CME70_00330 [Halobacteriovorax sp.]|nr:hypothetical protein [Halobacteriovorax sp.]|tara:strand:+ start:10297 stop:11670 length:1374 start_codon:yes stop_codon:yes gene_type:complete